MDNNQINRDYGAPEETPGSTDQSGRDPGQGNSGQGSAGQDGRDSGQGSAGQGSSGQNGSWQGNWNYGQNNPGQGNWGNGQNSYGQGSWDYNRNTAYYQTNYGTGGYNSYYNGRPPVDENGNPMKNNFAMKLVFSILEMVSLLMCNVISFILGLLGCIFTCKANDAYKKGDAEQFKSAKTTSTVCLWIGFAFNVIAAIFLIFYLVIFFNFFDLAMELAANPEYMEKFSEGDWTLEDLREMKKAESLDEFFDMESGILDEFTGYSRFELDGAMVEVPMDMDDFLELGYYVEDVDSTYLDTYEYEIYPFYNSSAMTAPIGAVTVANDGYRRESLDELSVVSIWVYKWEEEDARGRSFRMANGIDFDTTKTEVLALFGDTVDVQELEGGSKVYTWYPMKEDAYNYVEITFYGEEILSVDICYYGY